MTKEPRARGGSPDRCVCPRLLSTLSYPLCTPSPHTRLPAQLLPRPLPLAAPGGSYTNFQECLLPPSVPLEPSLPPAPRPPLRFAFAARRPLPSPGTSRTSSRVSIATWGRVFAYYTLCVTSRLVMYARVGVGYPAPRSAGRGASCAKRASGCKRVRERSYRGGLQRNRPEV